MMTKQHFEAIANVLNANNAPLSLVLDFADMCEESNPRFDRTKFVQWSTKSLLDEHEYNVRAIKKQRGE
jgi:hypothetical protein